MNKIATEALVIGCTFVAAAFGGAGCTTARSSTAEPAGIGPSGGQITLEDGSSISVPAGALTSQVAISMAPLSRASSPGAGVVGGAAYLLTPEGLTFDVPVTLTIAFSPSALPVGTQASDLVLLTAPAGVTDYAFAMRTIVVDGTHVAAQTSHFSDAWLAARNTVSGGQRIVTTGTQGGPGGASFVCFTQGCSTNPPSDICAGRAEPCGKDSPIPCCQSDVCVDGACASSGTKPSGGGMCGDKVPTCVYYGACTTHADCATMNAADTACQKFAICGADGSCCPKAGAPCNSASDCCRGLNCNAHVCSTLAQEPDPCQGGVSGGGAGGSGAGGSGAGGSGAGGGAGATESALTCAWIADDSWNYPACNCRQWKGRWDAEAQYGVNLVGYGPACPTSVSPPTGQPVAVDCCEVGAAPNQCFCAASVSFPRSNTGASFADCDAWVAAQGATRVPSCP